MAFTKLYLTNTAPVYTPATLRGAWDFSGNAVTKALESTKVGGGALTAVTLFEGSATVDYDVLGYRGISGGLAAQTISGTVNVCIGVVEPFGSQDFFWHLHLYVTQGDSDTPRGTLLADYVEVTNEWPVNPNASYAYGVALASAQSLSSLAIQDGDRLVAEIGYVARNNFATLVSGFLCYGTEYGSAKVVRTADLTVGGAIGSANIYAGFLSFSNSIAEPLRTNRTTSVSVRSYSPVGESPGRVTQVSVRTFSAKPISARVTQASVRVYNRQPPGRLIITKTTAPGGSTQPFTFHIPGLTPDTFVLLDGESREFVQIPTGIYSVTEDPVTGWIALLTVNNGDDPTAIAYQYGDTLTVTALNTRVSAVAGAACPAPTPVAAVPQDACPAPDPA